MLHPLVLMFKHGLKPLLVIHNPLATPRPRPHCENLEKIRDFMFIQFFMVLQCVFKSHSAHQMSPIVRSCGLAIMVSTLGQFTIDTAATRRSFETHTEVNSGGAVLLQQLLNRQLFWLSCRHHVAELILKAAFQSLRTPHQRGLHGALGGCH